MPTAGLSVSKNLLELIDQHKKVEIRLRIVHADLRQEVGQAVGFTAEFSLQQRGGQPLQFAPEHFIVKQCFCKTADGTIARAQDRDTPIAARSDRPERKDREQAGANEAGLS